MNHNIAPTPEVPLRINYLGNYGHDYSYCRYMARAGHKPLFYSDLKVHPRLSIAYYHRDIREDDIARIRIEDMLSTPHLNMNIHATDILRKISDCDVLQVNGMYGMWAALSGKPYLYKPFGGDINHWPFLDDTEADRIRAFYIRTIVQNATLLLGFLHQKKFSRVIDELDLDRSRIRGWCFPMNAEAYRPLPPEQWMEIRKSLDGEGKFVIFSCTQLMMRPTPIMQYTKGSDRFLQGVKMFMDEVGPENMTFWVQDRGPQKEEFKEMARALGVMDRIQWLPPFQREDFIRHMNAADVILDQIDENIANHGYICVEGMSCGTPVFTWIDKEHREKVAGEPPIPNINVRTAEDVRDELLCLYSDPEALKKASVEGRQFVLEHHHWPAACKKYAAIFREAMTLHAQKGQNQQ